MYMDESRIPQGTRPSLSSSRIWCVAVSCSNPLCCGVLHCAHILRLSSCATIRCVAVSCSNLVCCVVLHRAHIPRVSSCATILCCSVLQRCSVLQCVAAMQCVAVDAFSSSCGANRYVAAWATYCSEDTFCAWLLAQWSVLQCVAVCCSAKIFCARRFVQWFSVWQHVAV